MIPAMRGASESTRLVVVALATLFLMFVVAAIHLGAAAPDLSPIAAAQAVWGDGQSLAEQVVRQVVLPRTVAAVVSGMALAVAGVLLQTVTGNGLAAPATLGVNAGAYAAAVVAAVVLPAMSASATLGVTFLGGLLAAAAVFVAAGGFRAGPLQLVLAGVAIAMACSAASSTLQVLFENETAGLYFWGSGTLIQRDWSGVQTLGAPLAVGGAAALLLARPLDVLRLGEDAARGLGQRVPLVRSGAVIVGVWLAASVVALTGPIGFIGLIAPHLARLLGLRSHLTLLPAAGLIGAALLLGADLVALMLEPVAGGVVPAGIVTGFVGAPWLIGLARAARGETSGGATGRSRSAGAVLSPTCMVTGAGIVAVAAVAMAVMLGTPWLSPAELFHAAWGDDAMARLLVQMRLPRTGVAALAGIGLAVSGLLYQGVIRNPLAAPETLGATAGAALGALLLLLGLPQLPVHWAPVGAAVGAVLAFSATYALAWRRGIDPARLALIGIAVATVCMSVTSILVIRSDLRLAQAIVWLAGTTYGRDAAHVLVLAIGLAVLLPPAVLCVRPLDVMALGDDASRTLGAPLGRWRLAVLGLATALTALAVAIVGTVGFLGLVAPHAARLLVGSRHRWLLPLTALIGGTTFVLADTLGRCIAAPREIPAGLVTAMLGAPYFLWLLRRQRR